MLLMFYLLSLVLFLPADVLLAATCSISTVIIDGVQYVMIAHFDALMQWLGFNAMIGSISRSAIVLRY